MMIDVSKPACCDNNDDDTLLSDKSEMFLAYQQVHLQHWVEYKMKTKYKNTFI